MLNDLMQAAARAQTYLLAQAERQFEETRHVMLFPHAAGFGGVTERQSSDLFARATLAGVLLDIAELEQENAPLRATLYDLARREADYVARSKLRDRAGGWSYFPELPELPPDLDSLSAALHLFARVAPAHTRLCAEPVALALSQARRDGSLGTWLIAPTDAAARRVEMERGVSEYWGDATDTEVCASFYLALLAYDRARFAAVAAEGAQYVISQQRSDGSWEATWYWPRPYGVGLCLRLLGALGTGEDAINRARDFLVASQRPDGGWGVWQTVPLDTALALWALDLAGVRGPRADFKNAVSALLREQDLDGSWEATPWIKMEIGRAAGTVLRTATYQSTTLTTAFCLRALLLSRARL